MKFGSFFGVVTDAMDVVSMFEGVESVEQMVSRLEVIKRRGAEDLLMNVAALKMSIDTAMNDTLELGGSIGGPEEGDNGEESDDLDFGEEELGNLEEEKEEPNPKDEKKEPDTKTEQKT